MGQWEVSPSFIHKIPFLRIGCWMEKRVERRREEKGGKDSFWVKRRRTPKSLDGESKLSRMFLDCQPRGNGEIIECGMKGILEYFRVAGGMFNGGERRGGSESGSLNPHPLHLPLLCFRELGSYDNEAEVDHEKWSNLSGENERIRYTTRIIATNINQINGNVRQHSSDSAKYTSFSR